MKCINEEQIQKYIDGETDLQETDQIKKHLTECSRCLHNVEEQKAFTEAIKRKLGNIGKQTVIIPEFVAPNIRKRRLSLKIRRYIYTVSAACVILLIVFLRYGRNTEPRCNPTVQMIYSFDGNFDSNKTVSQQEMTIVVIDANGKIIDSN